MTTKYRVTLLLEVDVDETLDPPSEWDWRAMLDLGPGERVEVEEYGELPDGE